MGIFSWLKRHRLRPIDEEDFKEELKAHLAIATEERTAEGADPESARYEALREFGNVTLTTEAVRSVWRPRWLEALSSRSATSATPPVPSPGIPALRSPSSSF